jgi:ABC-type phosphate transport system permease subunit
VSHNEPTVAEKISYGGTMMIYVVIGLFGVLVGVIATVFIARLAAIDRTTEIVDRRNWT